MDTSPNFIFWPEMLPALAAAPALEWISMSNYTMSINIDGNVLAAMGRNPSVKVIQIRALHESTSHRLLQHIHDFAKMKLYIGEGKEYVVCTNASSQAYGVGVYDGLAWSN